MKTKKKAKKPQVNRKALEETILEWTLREHPEEEWAVRDFECKDLTFADMEASMAAGEGWGKAGSFGDTPTRELIFKRLATLVGKSVNELGEWCKAQRREKLRREYAAHKDADTRFPDWSTISWWVGRMAVSASSLEVSLSGIDLVAFADIIGGRGIREILDSIARAKDRLDSIRCILYQAEKFV